MKSDKLKKDIFKTFLFLLIILVLAAQYSCTTTRKVNIAPEDRILLTPDKPQKGTWQSHNLVLDYEIVKEDGTVGLIIDGRTTRRLDQVVVWVLFLDENGKLLERETVFNSGFRTQRTKARRIEGTIERAYEVPEGAKYMAFQYLKQPYKGRR